MAAISRDPVGAAGDSYDLIIIGGGIYGAMLALQSVVHGLRPLLVEQNDFGGSTSFNSLRILHGGFRYLQSLNLSRFMISVLERRWFLRTFPHLTHPMPFLMPLYGTGLRKPKVLKIALAMNDLLSLRRNEGVNPDKHLPLGQVLDSTGTKAIFPEVNIKGLQGGAVWFDACIPDSQRILMEILSRACSEGARVLNYVRAVGLSSTPKRVTGITGQDMETGEVLGFRSRVVINAAGPWCREIALKCHRDFPSLFKPSLAWNVLFDRKPLSEYGLALTPRKSHARTYFLVPWKGALLAGTGHAPWSKGPEKPRPTDAQLREFLIDLNLAMPCIDLRPEDIRFVFSGLLPATRQGGCELVDRPVVLNHGRHGGSQGLFSVSGVKFTTARHVAAQTLRLVSRTGLISKTHRTNGRTRSRVAFSEINRRASISEWLPVLRSIIIEECPLHLDDLILRRTSFWDDPIRAMEAAQLACDYFPWDGARRRDEIRRLRLALPNPATHTPQGSEMERFCL